MFKDCLWYGIVWWTGSVRLDTLSKTQTSMFRLSQLMVPQIHAGADIAAPALSWSESGHLLFQEWYKSNVSILRQWLCWNRRYPSGFLFILREILHKEGRLVTVSQTLGVVSWPSVISSLYIRSYTLLGANDVHVPTTLGLRHAPCAYPTQVQLSLGE
jgi:hypothetical protein